MARPSVPSYPRAARPGFTVCGNKPSVKLVLLLCTVGVNLQDCPPFASLHRPDLSPADETTWNGLYAAGVSLETEGRWADAAAQYQEAGRRDDGFAELHFRLARCWLALGRDAEARDHFQKASDEDALRFRADRQINRIIREAAAAWGEREFACWTRKKCFPAMLRAGFLERSSFTS